MIQQLQLGTDTRSPHSSIDIDALGLQLPSRVLEYWDRSVATVAMSPNPPRSRVRSTRALVGLEVTDRYGDRVGRIEKIMRDPSSGRIAYAIVSPVRPLAYAGLRFPIPWEALRPREEGDGLWLDIEWRDLEAAPAFHSDDWPDMSDRCWSSEVHAYYGLGPYWAPAAFAGGFRVRPRLSRSALVKHRRRSDSTL